MFSVLEASDRILADIRPLSVERVPLLDSLGRVLAAPIVAPLTIPAWDNSAMDGYAARSEDIETAAAESPVSLTVLETVAAGAFPTQPVSAGNCTREMTGG